MLDFQATPLADGGRGRAAGRQRPPDRHPDRRVPDQRRPHQHRRQLGAACGAVLRRDRAARVEWRRRNGRPRPAAAPTARRSTRRSARSPRHKPAAHWIELFEDAGIPCGPIYTIDQVFADPQVQHLGMATTDQAVRRLGDIELVASAINISGFSQGDPRARRRRPARHGRRVLRCGRLHRRGDRRHAARRERSDGCCRIMRRPKHYAGGKMLAAKDDGVGLITFNQPEKRNAMSVEMWQGLGEILDEFAEDSRCRVVVLTGAGQQGVRLGRGHQPVREAALQRRRAEANTTARTGVGRAQARRVSRSRPSPASAASAWAAAWRSRCRRICASPRPTASSAFPPPGSAIAYGFERCAARLAGRSGARADDPLHRRSAIDAAEAERIGLINRVVADEDLSDAVLDIARTIADNAPLSVAASKLADRAGAARLQPSATWRAIARPLAACFNSADYREGRTAFLEKRPPRFQGR